MGGLMCVCVHVWGACTHWNKLEHMRSGIHLHMLNRKQNLLSLCITIMLPCLCAHVCWSAEARAFCVCNRVMRASVLHCGKLVKKNIYIYICCRCYWWQGIVRLIVSWWLNVQKNVPWILISFGVFVILLLSNKGVNFGLKRAFEKVCREAA